MRLVSNTEQRELYADCRILDLTHFSMDCYKAAVLGIPGQLRIGQVASVPPGIDPGDNLAMKSLWEAQLWAFNFSPPPLLSCCCSGR